MCTTKHQISNNEEEYKLVHIFININIQERLRKCL